ncbi:MAG: DUF3788 family protein [Bacteroidota bacterium]|jgi:hypothetical protein
MEYPLLFDKTLFPDDEILSVYLGRSIAAWHAFTAMVETEFPDVRIDWKYYADGGSWLCKVSKKKKTICWISVREKMFRTAFYFHERLESEVALLPIAGEILGSFVTAKKFGKLKPLIIESKTKNDVNTIREVMIFKMRTLS